MASPLAIDAFALTDTGRERKENQDAVGLREPDSFSPEAQAGNVYVVADGVGGHLRGGEASRLAVERLLAAYYQSAVGDRHMRLDRTIQHIGLEVQALADRSKGETVATTLVVAVVRDRQLIVGHVGDSRAYLVRGEKIRRLTSDHSLLQRLLDENSLTDEQARNFGRKNVITQGLGLTGELSPDYLVYDNLSPGDVLLLCSDGLHGYFWDDADLLPYLAGDASAEATAQRLVAAANDRGGEDNISVVVVRFLEGDDDDAANPVVASTQPIASEMAGALADDPMGVTQPGIVAADLDEDLADFTPAPDKRKPQGRASLLPWLWPALLSLVAVMVLGGLAAVGVIGLRNLSQGSAAEPQASVVATEPLPTMPATALPQASDLPDTETAVATEAVVAETDTPAPTATPEGPPLCVWVVRPGDTVGGIAARALGLDPERTIPEAQRAAYQLEVDEIVARNGLPDENSIFADQQLVVPWQAGPLTGDPAAYTIAGQPYPGCPADSP